MRTIFEILGIIIVTLAVDRLFLCKPRRRLSAVSNRVKPVHLLLRWARRCDVIENASEMRFRVAIRETDDHSWDDALYLTHGGPVTYFGLERVERRRVRKELARYYLHSNQITGPNNIWVNDWQEVQQHDPVTGSVRP